MSLLKETQIKKSVKFVCGIFLILNLLSPLINIEIADFTAMTNAASTTAEQYSAYGKKMAQQAAADIIKQETEAYIINKSMLLNMDVIVNVDVRTGETPALTHVTISGSAPHSRRNILKEQISYDLGISQENITWIG